MRLAFFYFFENIITYLYPKNMKTNAGHYRGQRQSHISKADDTYRMVSKIIFQHVKSLIMIYTKKEILADKHNDCQYLFAKDRNIL